MEHEIIIDETRWNPDCPYCKVDISSRGMFIARLEMMQKDGDKWLTIESVLALLNDCDMLANLELKD